MKMSSLVSFDLLKNVAIACLLYTVLSWLFGWNAKKERADRVSLDSNKKRVAKNSDGPITSVAQYLRSQLSQIPSSSPVSGNSSPSNRFALLPYPSSIDEKTKQTLMMAHGFTEADVTRIRTKLRSKGGNLSATMVISQEHLRDTDCVKLLCILSCMYSLVLMIQLTLPTDGDKECSKEATLSSIYADPDITRLINANLLPKHRILAFTTEKGKVAIVRQVRPDLYIDHSQTSCSSLLSHVRVIVTIDPTSEKSGAVYSYERGNATTASPKITSMKSYAALLA